MQNLPIYWGAVYTVSVGPPGKTSIRSQPPSGLPYLAGQGLEQSAASSVNSKNRLERLFDSAISNCQLHSFMNKHSAIAPSSLLSNRTAGGRLDKIWRCLGDAFHRAVTNFSIVREPYCLWQVCLPVAFTVRREKPPGIIHI